MQYLVQKKRPEENPFSRTEVSLRPDNRIVEKLLGCKTDADLSALVEERLQYLNETITIDPKEPLFLAGSILRPQLIYTDFIPASKRTHAGLTARPYLVDDPEIYRSAALSFLERERTCAHSRRFLNIIDSIQDAVVGYFGWFKPGASAEMTALLRTRGSPVSMRELKGKDIAICFQRTTVAHNILKFFGQDALFVMGEAYLDGEARHSYEIIRTSARSGYLFEVTNPKIIENNDDTISIEAATYRLTSRELKQILSCRGVWKGHVDYVRNEGSLELKFSSRRFGPATVRRKMWNEFCDIVKELSKA